jgi:hypothetical protein
LWRAHVLHLPAACDRLQSLQRTGWHRIPQVSLTCVLS